MKQLSNGLVPRGFFNGKGGRGFPGAYFHGETPFSDFAFPGGPRFPQPGDFFPAGHPMNFMGPHPGNLLHNGDC